MSSVYARLGFNSNDAVTNSTVSVYSSQVDARMNLMPQMVNSWQQSDIASANAYGYFVNPVANVSNSIISFSNTLVTLLNAATGSTSAITNSLANSNTYGSLIYNTVGNNYLYITNRESNVVNVGNDVTTPHYKTAMGLGKILSYLTYQTDGVQNNSPIMGNFTSITLANTLNSLSNTYSNLINLLANSFTGNTSNITLSNALALENTANQLVYFMTYYPNQDTQFFRNSQNVVNDFSTVTQFSKIGGTEQYLLTNYIGTPKLISRLSANN